MVVATLTRCQGFHMHRINRRRHRRCRYGGCSRTRRSIQEIIIVIPTKIEHKSQHHISLSRVKPKVKQAKTSLHEHNALSPASNEARAIQHPWCFCNLAKVLNWSASVRVTPIVTSSHMISRVGTSSELKLRLLLCTIMQKQI